MLQVTFSRALCNAMTAILQNRFRVTLTERSGICGRGGESEAWRASLRLARAWIAERRELQAWDGGEILCVATLRTMKVKANIVKRPRVVCGLRFGPASYSASVDLRGNKFPRR